MPDLCHSQTDEKLRKPIARSNDYLKIRLRRMVKIVINQESGTSISYPTAKILNNKNQHLIIKGLCLALLGVCLTVFTYQMYERVSHYFDYPVAVDVFITRPKIHTFPEVTICYPGLTRILKKKRSWLCMELILNNIYYAPDGKTTEQIWKEINSSIAIITPQEIKGDYVQPLKFTEVPLSMGTCSTFRSSNNDMSVKGEHYFNITFEQPSDSNCLKTLPANVFVHDPGDFPSSRKHTTFMVANNGEISMKKRKFVFVNRTNSPCISAIKRQECWKDCFANYITKIGANKCRFPFYPPKMNISAQCLITQDNTLRTWIRLHNYMFGVEHDQCNCLPKCVHSTFEERKIADKNVNGTWTFLLRYESMYETIITERLSYQLLDLLCDIGGNSGLFIGVSLLSVFQLGYMVVRLWKKLCQTKPSKFLMNDPLYNKVIKTYNSWKKVGNKTNRPVKIPKRGNVAVILMKIVTLMCVCLLIILSLNRLYFYFQYPLQTTVVVTFATTLEAPSLILCGGDDHLLKLQQEAASSENKSNPCDVEKWELFRLTSVTAEDIWPNVTLPRKLPPYNIEDYPVRSVFDGACFDMKEDEILVHSTKLWFFLGQKIMIGQCKTGDIKAYIRDSTGALDYYRYTHFSVIFENFLYFLIKEIHIDQIGVACVSREENELCLKNCLNRKLSGLITCRLPYMPDFDLPLCHKISTVRQAHLAFRDLFFVPGNTEDCNCFPKCQTQFMEVKLEIGEETQHGSTVLNFRSEHNVIESYVKQRAYSFVKLLCDLGGLMSSILGLCILDVTETALSAVASLRRKRQANLYAFLNLY